MPVLHTIVYKIEQHNQLHLCCLCGMPVIRNLLQWRMLLHVPQVDAFLSCSSSNLSHLHCNHLQPSSQAQGHLRQWRPPVSSCKVQVIANQYLLWNEIPAMSVIVQSWIPIRHDLNSSWSFKQKTPAQALDLWYLTLHLCNLFAYLSLAPVILRWTQIGRAHVWTPVTSAHLVCRLLLEKKKTKKNSKCAYASSLENA